MPSMLGRLMTLAKSPQGQKVVRQIQTAARDPKNRERIDQLRARVSKRR